MFKFGTDFEGRKITGVGLIYDFAKCAKKFEPKYMLTRNELATNVDESRKQMKEEKEQGEGNCRGEEVQGFRSYQEEACKHISTFWLMKVLT